MPMNLDLFVNQTESALKGDNTLGSSAGSVEFRCEGSPPEKQFLSVLVAAVALAKQQRVGRTDLLPIPDEDAINTVPLSDESKMDSLFSEAGSDWIELLDPASTEELVNGAAAKPSGDLTDEMPDLAAVPVSAVPESNGFVVLENRTDDHLVPLDQKPLQQGLDSVHYNTDRQSFEEPPENSTNCPVDRTHAEVQGSPGQDSGLKQINTPETGQARPLTDTGQQPARKSDGHGKNTDASMPSRSVRAAPEKLEADAEIRHSPAPVGEDTVRESTTAKLTGTAFADQTDRPAAEVPVRQQHQSADDNLKRSQKPGYAFKVVQAAAQNDTPFKLRQNAGEQTLRFPEPVGGHEYNGSGSFDKTEGVGPIAATGDPEPESDGIERVDPKQTVFSRPRESQTGSVGTVHKAPATPSSQTIRLSEETGAAGARQIGSQATMRDNIPTESQSAADPSVSTLAGSSGADFARRIKENQPGRTPVVEETTETGRITPSRQDTVPVSKPFEPGDNISARAAVSTTDRSHETAGDKRTADKYFTAPSVKGEPEAVRYQVETMNIEQSNTGNTTGTEFERVADARMIYGGNNRIQNDEAQVRQPADNAGSTDSARLSAEAEKYQKVLRLNQIVDKAALHFKNGASEVQIELKPEYLGRVRMQIAAENRQVIVKIMAELPAVREIIESDLSQLKTELQNQGVSVDKLDVSVFSEADEKENSWQQTEASRNRSDKSKRKKRGDDQNDPPESAAASRTDDREQDNGISFFA